MTPEEEMRARLIAEAAKMKIPLAALDPTSPWMVDMDTAVSEALKRIEASQNAEHAGVIYQNPDGQYAYSIPLAMRLRDEFSLNVQPTKDRKLVAIWHRHPNDSKQDDSLLFSPDDLNVADKLNLPSYIHFLGDNTLRSYTPKKTKTFSKRMPGTMMPVRVSRGDDVVLVPPQLFAQESAP